MILTHVMWNPLSVQKKNNIVLLIMDVCEQVQIKWWKIWTYHVYNNRECTIKFKILIFKLLLPTLNLHIGHETLGFSLIKTWQWLSKWRKYVSLHTFKIAQSEKFCLMTLPLFLFMLSSPPDLIMEILFYMEFQTLSLISSNEHKTQLLVYFQKLVNMIT